MAAAEVTQSVGCPELRSLEKMQLCFDVSLIPGCGTRWKDTFHGEKSQLHENTSSASNRATHENNLAVWRVVKKLVEM